MANCPMSSLPMKNMMSSSPMENLTVTQATYKPHTVHLRKKPPVTLEKRHAGPWTVVTTHRDTYRIEKEAFATITKPPKDHWFLAGDGLSRFGSTVYGTDYSKRPGQPGRPKTPKPLIPSQKPMETETTTESEYQRPKMQKIWRYAEKVPEFSQDLIENMTEYRKSYKAQKFGDLRRFKAPNHYKPKNYQPRKTIPSVSQNCTKPVKAHAYD